MRMGTGLMILMTLRRMRGAVDRSGQGRRRAGRAVGREKLAVMGFCRLRQDRCDGDRQADANEIGRRRQDDACGDAAGFAIGGGNMEFRLAVLIDARQAEFGKCAIRQGQKGDFSRRQVGDGGNRRAVGKAKQNERDDADDAYRSIKPSPDVR